ncbi:MAG: HRDC domain-containing protein [Chloroflexota bacterium]|nr:HRDC domain-containing protein [Chloroflexota bacterium]
MITQIVPIAEPILVYNDKTLAQMLTHLSKQPLFALDTESDSLYRYQPRVCLIQISTYADAAQGEPNQIVDYLVDPLRLEKLTALGLLLADPTIEVVMHAAENDILELNRDFQFTFQPVFDTQLAARILGWGKVGLAAILEEHFGVVSDKRMQRTDWGKRPLTPQQIAYAQMDTHYLPALRTVLIEQLKHMGRWEEAQDAFALLGRSAHQERAGRTPADERTFWSMKTAREVPRALTGVLEALWQWRERVAQRRNSPPFKILGDQPLVALTLQHPTGLNEIERSGGLNSQQMERYGADLREAIIDGLQRPLPALPEPRPRPEQTLDRAALARYDALRVWRSRVAGARGVALDIIFNNQTLLELAKRAPRTPDELLEIPEIGPWKAKNYGPDLLTLLQRKR